MLDLQPAVELLRREIAHVFAVYVFGSFAVGEATPESDIDLAVLAPGEMSPEQRWDLQGKLELLLHRDVDLVDLREASTVMRVQVLSTGTLLFEAPGSARAFFEAHALSDYARLNEERRGILEDARATGRIHG